MVEILCVGRAVWDQIFFVHSLPLIPGKVSALQHKEAGGGPAATAAVAIARLGGKVRIWSMVGDDKAGQNIINELSEYGVDVSGVRAIPNLQSPVAAVMVDANGERAIAAYVDNDLYRSTDCLSNALPPETKMVLADTKWLEGAQHVLELADNQGVPSVLDVEKTDHPNLGLVISLAEYAVFSEDGLMSFTGEVGMKSALFKAASCCKGIACVTIGDNGCMWIEGDEVMHQPSFPVNTVDTTGAGDVFHGALALGLSRGDNFAEAARFACAAAAMKCTKPGGREGIPDQASLLEFLHHH